MPVCSVGACDQYRALILNAIHCAAAAAARAAKVIGDTKAQVYVPQGSDSNKVHGITLLGAQTIVYGSNCLDTEQHARHEAEQHDKCYVSPYNDEAVVCGQGTIAIEMLQQARESHDTIDVIFASVGGGGLLGGIAAYVKATQPNVRIVACQPENSRVMLESIHAGHIIDFAEQDTLSTATAGGIEQQAITFNLIDDHVDEFVTVSEAEIAQAMALMISHEHTLIEGAAAVAVAAFFKESARFADATVAIVLCGKNVPVEVVRSVLNANCSTEASANTNAPLS
jgi:threonine dehydratase